MTWQFTPFAVPLFVCALLLLVTIISAWQRRSTPGAYAYIGLVIGIMAYALGYALEIGSLSPQQVLTALKIEYLSVLSPVFLIMVVLQYTTDRRITKPILYTALFAPAVMTLILAFTSEYHAWIWQITALDRSNGFTATLFDQGLWYWVNIVYSRGLILIGVILLALAVRREKVYRRQVRWMLLGAVTPVIVTIPYLMGIFPPGLDVIPYAFTLSALAIAWALFQDRLFDVLPVAREAILSSMGESVFVLDSENRLIYLNKAAQRQTEFIPEDVIGKPAGDVFAPWGEVAKMFRVNEEKTDEFSADIRGEQRFFRMTQKPLRAKGDADQGRLLVLSDITERVKSEKALKEAMDEQQKLVEDLDAFAHMVAHDLKNPLATIIGMSELLSEEMGSTPIDTMRSQLVSVQSSAETANGIIDSLLLMARLRAGLVVPIAPLDMNLIIELAVGRLKAVSESYRAVIHTPDSCGSLAIGYAPWVEAIWANYVSNAIKYGGRPPVVTLGSDKLDENTVRFWVQDNGAGLTEEQIGKLFIPFSRLHQRRRDSHGLGLTIARRIAEQLNGKAGVQSTVGKGSRFYFDLPVIPEKGSSDLAQSKEL